jgi:hypothetical protein
MKHQLKAVGAAAGLALLTGCVTYPYEDSFTRCDNAAAQCYRGCDDSYGGYGDDRCRRDCDYSANRCFDSAYDPYRRGYSYGGGYGPSWPWRGSYGYWYPDRGYSYTYGYGRSGSGYRDPYYRDPYGYDRPRPRPRGDHPPSRPRGGGSPPPGGGGGGSGGYTPPPPPSGGGGGGGGYTPPPPPPPPGGGGGGAGYTPPPPPPPPGGGSSGSSGSGGYEPPPPPPPPRETEYDPPRERAPRARDAEGERHPD